MAASAAAAGSSTIRVSQPAGKGIGRGAVRRPKVAEASDVEDEEDQLRHKSTPGGYAELLKVLSMLVLSTAHTTRILVACSLEVRIMARTVSGTSSLLDRTKTVTSDLQAHLKDLSESERRKLGSPHCHTWEEAVHWMEDEVAPDDQETKTALLAYRGSMEALSTEDKIWAVSKQVRWFYTAPCWTSQLGKLLVNVQPETPARAVWKRMDHMIMTRLKGELKQGIAPRSNLERRVQIELDKLRK